jgi:hypothetical protein
MHITLVKEISLEELMEKFRDVPLKEPAPDSSPIYVYKDASISLREFDPREVNPTTFYVLRHNLQFQRDLRKVLLESGIDSLHLNGAVVLQDEQGKQRTLMPPVIELGQRTISYVPGPHEITHHRKVTINIPLINDGAHRVMLARELGQTFHGIYVVGADPSHPFYAHPNSWDDVQIMDSVPATPHEKKLYLRENCATLYRNFDVFGCGTLRSPGST